MPTKLGTIKAKVGVRSPGSICPLMSAPRVAIDPPSRKLEGMYHAECVKEMCALWAKKCSLKQTKKDAVQSG